MKAIVINKQDKSLSLAEVPYPVLNKGEVIIEVYASAINRADLLQREGNYPPPPGCPEWPGLEVAGVIKEAIKSNQCDPEFLCDELYALTNKAFGA